jgi:hypothetical protein
VDELIVGRGAVWEMEEPGLWVWWAFAVVV